jgi:hypothetical protein
MHANAIASFELKTFFKSFGRKLRSSKCFSLLRNFSERNYEQFYLWRNGSERNFRSSKCVSLLRNGLEQNFEIFLPRNVSKRNSVCSMSHEANFYWKMTTLPWLHLSQKYLIHISDKIVFWSYRQHSQNCHFYINCVTSKVEIFCYNHGRNICDRTCGSLSKLNFLPKSSHILQ